MTFIKKRYQDTRSIFYENMLRIRLIEERIAAEYCKEEMRCPVHLSIGQEAVAVGVCSSLEKHDEVLSGHRSHAHYLAKGGSLKRMLAEIMGKGEGCTHGVGGSMHLIDKSCGFRGAVPIVGSIIPIAVGLSFQHSIDSDDKVVVVFFGDGATEEGVFHESLNFAALKNLPIIFVCENNLYSVYSPMKVRQPKNRSLSKLVKGHGVESHKADGNDVVTVYELLQNAVGKARSGDGPTFFEFSTYRWREHCGPNYDNSLGYRTEEEFLEWKKRCPVDQVKKQLKNTDDKILIEQLEKEIDEAFAYARALPSLDLR